MKKQVSSMKSRYQVFRRNMQALKQANITLSQMANCNKASNAWWKITVNLRELEGSWTGAMKKYMKMFEGVPRKNIRQTDDNQTGNPS